MGLIFGRWIKKDSQTLKNNASDELEVKIKSSSWLEKTADGLAVLVNDSVTALTNLWTAQKISNELQNKASITYVDNAILGLKWKAPIIDFKTQAQIDALSPQSGDRYIVTDGTNANKIAEYITDAWTYTVPLDNWTVMRKSDDKSYTYDADTTAWVATSITGGESRVVEEITLDAGMISAKKVTLTYTPLTAAYVELVVLGGGEMDYGSDYSVNVGTKELSWSGLTLDGVLVVGDILKIKYQK